MPVSVKQRAKANEQSPSLDTTCHSALMARSSAPLHNLQLHVNRYNMTPIQTLFSKRMDSAAQSVLPFPIDIGRDNPIRQRNAVIPHQTVIIVSVQRITEFISIELISPSEHSRISIFDKFVSIMLLNESQMGAANLFRARLSMQSGSETMSYSSSAGRLPNDRR